MKNIYTYGGEPARRHLIVGCLMANKAAEKRQARRKKMTQVTAFDAEEAAAAADARIDTLTIDCHAIEAVRAAAPHIFITGAQHMRQYVIEDEALGGAIDTMAKAPPPTSSGGDLVGTFVQIRSIPPVGRIMEVCQ